MAKRFFLVVNISMVSSSSRGWAEIDPETMTDYLNGLKWGCPPHSGGASLERVVVFTLKPRDVRWASLIPKDRGASPRWTSLLLRQPWLPLRTSFSACRSPQSLPPGTSSSMRTSASRIGMYVPTFLYQICSSLTVSLSQLITKYCDPTITSWIDLA